MVKALNLVFDAVYLWSDSTVTLTWIGTEPFKLKTFIANRVSEIQELTIRYFWKHIDTQNNPADIISRGLTPKQFVSNTVWFNGPLILYERVPESEFEKIKSVDYNTLEFKPEYVNFLIQPAKVANVGNVPDCEFLSDLIERHNSYIKILRILVYCLRWKRKSKEERTTHTDKFLSNSETEGALAKIMLAIQSQYFQNEITSLLKYNSLPSKCSIVALNPFIDEIRILRVGGRITNSELAYDNKHPMLMPANHHFTKLIFRHFHTLNIHAGPQLPLSLVRQKFWPISGKNISKNCVRSCITCFRNRPRFNTQLMGNLPASRVTPARPFQTTGVDYCGPMLVKDKKIRTSREYKVYIAMFVCFVTKAVHLEIVSDLTSESFLACLKRFIYRRGKPATIWSDNATTFVGAHNELMDLHSFLQNQKNLDRILKFCTLEEVSWKFIPPRSPNFGGLWESSVKSFNTHLKRCTTGSKCSFEELNTLIIQVEGILNWRPLTLLSDDPSDSTPLTPSHFLCGTTIRSPAEPSLLEIPTNRLSSWQKVTQMVQSFWKRFSVEYLNTLQQRVKWKQQGHNLKIRDVVLILDENLPPTQWLMGVIQDVIRGSDDLIRVLKIKSKNGIITRGPSTVCKLPID